MKFEELNSQLKAFITIKSLKEKEKGDLSGLTFGIKDIFNIKGVRTTAGSKILADFVPNSTAALVQKILDEGGTIEGKTNTHEFAIGATNTSSIAGPARNPRDPSRISGGSSGGSAVAVAAGMVDVGIGSDTGGSVRIPASLCGVIGFKPTFGLISVDGIIPTSPTLDTVGVITRDMKTMRATVSVLAGPKGRKALGARARRRPKLGLFRFGDDEASLVLQPALKRLSNAFDLKKVSFPLLEEKGASVRRTIMLAEAASYHRAWMAKSSGDYFQDVRMLLNIGLSTPAVDYIDAVRDRKTIVQEYLERSNGLDGVLSPTTKISAPRVDDVIGKEINYRETLVSNTELFNVVPAPSITIPVAKSKGLPIGMMITGALDRDGVVLELAEDVLRVLSSPARKRG